MKQSFLVELFTVPQATSNIHHDTRVTLNNKRRMQWEQQSDTGFPAVAENDQSGQEILFL
jgi:hypothetical protein